MNKIKHWLVPDWPAPANIHAATTLRTGGVSQGPYYSLNRATHVGDDTDRAMQNRQIIREMLDLPSEPVWLDQIHSNRAVKAENPPCPPLQKGGSGDFVTFVTFATLPLLHPPSPRPSPLKGEGELCSGFL